MRFAKSSCAFWFCFLVTAASVLAQEARESDVPDAIFRYMNRPEPDYHWECVDSRETPLGNVHRLELTSQKWQDIVWKHALVIYDPPQIAHPNQVLLFVTGGRNGKIPGDADFSLGLTLAQRCRARVAMLHQVPNQPLLGDHVEDDLITETWLKYLKTGDDSWPLLFPMVKSAVKAMDAVEEFAQQTWNTKIEGFVMTGASKRGWTSWLAPVVDQRIIATVPIVIDVLNFPRQMKNQKATWGYYSEQIADYTSKGLVNENGIPETPREKLLWRMMDPYTYRQQLKLPKLMIVGTNDPYWVVDAMGQYWDDLIGPKYVLQVPNAGHSLDGGRNDALTTLSVFFEYIAEGRSPPAIDWVFSRKDQTAGIDVNANPAPLAVKLWQTTSETRDFRKSKWTSQELTGEGARRFGSFTVPKTGHAAAFVELQFKEFGKRYSLTTLVYVP